MGDRISTVYKPGPLKNTGDLTKSATRGDAISLLSRNKFKIGTEKMNEEIRR